MEAVIDFANPNFGRWLVETFEHPPAPEGQEEWYWADSLDFVNSSPARFVRHVTKLCREFPLIAPAYSIEQVDQGIWYLLGGRGEFGACLLDGEIERAQRLACVHSMFHVYADFVAVLPHEVEIPTCFDMWWDLICTDFWNCVEQRVTGGPSEEEINRVAEVLNQASTVEEAQDALMNLPHASSPPIDHGDLNDDERAVHDAMLDTLERILKLDDAACRQYALHGLGHLRHPLRAKLVQNFIDNEANDWTPEGIRWLQKCRDGRVM